MKAINENAPIVCRKNIIILAKPEKIWQILTNIDEWPQWYKGISATKVNGPIQKGTSFTWKSGKFKINSILHTVEPFYYFGWTGKALGTTAIHNWILKSTLDGTEVSTLESMEGWVSRLMKGKLQKTLDISLTEWLTALKDRCEQQQEDYRPNIPGIDAL